MAQMLLHIFEQQLAAAAVFHQRILLTDAHPVNAFAQVVHVLEVLHPEIIQNLQVDVPLDFAHDFRRKGCFAAVVQFSGFGQQYAAGTCRLRCRTTGPACVVEREYFAHDVFEIIAGEQRRSGQHARLLLR